MVEIEKPRITCLDQPQDTSYGKYVVVAALAGESSDASDLSGREPRQRFRRVFRICNFTFHRFPPL